MIKPNDILPNGSRVLLVSDDQNVILAVNERGFLPYVTWRLVGGNPITSHSGRYYSTMLEAAKEFVGRIEHSMS